MKTLEQVIEQYKSRAFDNRDLHRLAAFVPVERFREIGLNQQEYTFTSNSGTKEWTRENILEQLRRDIAFGFEKALDKKSLSASCMFSVVEMWNWILEEGLEDTAHYAMYGLPLFKATALRYGFENPIGKDTGTEVKYG